MLIEVLVSALLVALIAVGTYTGLISANRASASERAKAQATVIAQQDEERLRGLSVAELSNLGSDTYKVAANGMCVEGSTGAWKYYSGTTTNSCEAVAGFKGTAYTGTVFTVTSSAQFVSAAKETFTCETEKGAASYIQTTSSVNWPSVGSHAPVSQSSLVAVPSAGSLMVKVKNRNNEPVSGATVVVTDPSTGTTPTAEEITPSSGCVIFGDLAEGEVKVVASKEGWVEHSGKAKPEKSLKVTTKALAEAEFTLDEPGAIVAKFINNGGQLVDSFTFVAFQSEIAAAAPFFVGGEATKATGGGELTGLFPFVTPPSTPNKYTVYAGSCEGNNPATVSGGEVQDASVPVEPNGRGSVSVEAPPVSVKVDEGESTTHPGNPLPESTTADVIDTECAGKTAQNYTSGVPYEYAVAIKSGALVQNLPYAKELVLCVVGDLSGTYYKNEFKLTNTKKAGTTFSTPFYLKASGYKTNSRTC